MESVARGLEELAEPVVLADPNGVHCGQDRVFVRSSVASHEAVLLGLVLPGCHEQKVAFACAHLAAALDAESALQ